MQDDTPSVIVLAQRAAINNATGALPCHQQLLPLLGVELSEAPRQGKQNSLKSRIPAFIIALTCEPFKIFVSFLSQENFYQEAVIISDKFQELTTLIF